MTYPDIPPALKTRWVFGLLAQIPIRLLSIPLAPFVVLTQRGDEAASWAKYFAPFDHAISGEDAGYYAQTYGSPERAAVKGIRMPDPMWLYWWDREIDDYDSRSWLCKALRKLGVYGTRHPLVRYWQVMRNWGGGFNYLAMGFDAGNAHVVRYMREQGRVREVELDADIESDDFLYLAYSRKDVVGIPGSDPEGPPALMVKPNAEPLAYYRGKGNRRHGWKLNRPVMQRCKWVLR